MSEEVVIYKVLWSTFFENFGKDTGAPVKHIRAKSVMDTNWINNVLKKLNLKSIEAIMSD